MTLNGQDSVWETNRLAYKNTNYAYVYLRRDVTGNYKRPPVRQYKLFMTPGDWDTVGFGLRKDFVAPYIKYSTLSFNDYKLSYDGRSYFGTPVHIASGAENQKDFNYCFGSAIFRFRAVGGGLLSSPYMSGNGTHKTNNVDDLSASVSAYSSVNKVANPDLEIFGPAANYTLNTVRVYAEDGSQIIFPPITFSLACNTTKFFDIPGPTLIVMSPQEDLITSASSVPVTGRSYSGSTIENIVVNGEAAVVTPVPGSSTNEVTFDHTIPLSAGKNILNITVTDVSNAQATDQRVVFADHWLPAVSITPASGTRFPDTETVIPFSVQASDQGYGYTLQVYLDGALISTTTGAENDTTPVAVSYAGTLDRPSIGEHVITAVATDLAGNSTTFKSIIEVYLARDMVPPVITLLGSPTVSVEAGNAYADAGATAFDDRDGDITSSIVTVNPVDTLKPGDYTITYNVTDAAGNPAPEVTRKATVVDTTAPLVTPPPNLTVEATGKLTAVVIGTATATDLVGVVSVTSDAPPAGFPIGTTVVTWTAVDKAGNKGTAAQTITIVDTTPPELSIPADQTVEALSANGATVQFSVTAKDLVTAAPTVVCTPPSGSVFPLGTTTVTCTATDDYNNKATRSFTVTVRDTTSPLLTVPAAITVLLNTSVNDPAVQAFLNGATAVDYVDQSVTITFTPPVLDSVGAKQVVFTAVDDFGNTTTATATIHVRYGCSGNFLTPVSLLRPFKLGSTIPVKLALCDANGSTVTSAVAMLFLQQYSASEPVGEPIEVTSTNADTGNYFRVSEGMYIYNLYTKDLTSGTYQIRAVLDDGSTSTISLLLKQ